MTITTILAGFVIAFFVFHALAMQALLARLAQSRASIADLLRQSQARTERTRTEMRTQWAANQDEMNVNRQRREEHDRFRAENIERFEELLRLQREQLSVLQRIDTTLSTREAGSASSTAV